MQLRPVPMCVPLLCSQLLLSLVQCLQTRSNALVLLAAILDSNCQSGCQFEYFLLNC